MTITDPEDTVRALLTEAPPSAATTQRGRDRLLALATHADANTDSTLPATPRRRRRRALTIGLPVTAAAAAVTAIALVAASSGTGAGPAQPGTAHAGGHSTSATSVKAKLLAAIGAAASQVLHVHTVEVTAGQTTSSDIWMAPWQASPGQTQRMRIVTDGEQDVELIYQVPTGTTSGTVTPAQVTKDSVKGRIIDVETSRHTWSDQASTPIEAGSPIESPAQLRQEISSGFFKIIARTQLAGQATLELRHTFPSPPGSRAWTRDLWVSAQTYLPIRSVSSSTEGTPAQGYQSDVTTNTFQFLPATAATLAHLAPVVPAGFTQTAKPPS
ncbi:MAG TPA: hypothetical protein VH089_12845, partial [Streptosporangiaceae bacterium]|nr:hypothetical protein [Streptosporangiaceae bacterium]